MHAASISQTSRVVIEQAEPNVEFPTSINEGPPSPRRQILIVNHDREAAETLALMCDILGWRSVITFSLKEACSLVDRYAFKLILADYYLPPDNGLMLIQKLRADGWEAPALLITNEHLIAEHIQIPYLKIRQILLEPVTIRELKTALYRSIRY